MPRLGQSIQLGALGKATVQQIARIHLQQLLQLLAPDFPKTLRPSPAASNGALSCGPGTPRCEVPVSTTPLQVPSWRSLQDFRSTAPPKGQGFRCLAEVQLHAIHANCEDGDHPDIRARTHREARCSEQDTAMLAPRRGASSQGLVGRPQSRGSDARFKTASSHDTFLTLLIR